MKNANLFGILWLIVGLAYFGLLLTASHIDIPNEILFFCTVLLLPLRLFLMESVLGLRLDGWLKWTIIGTIVGAIMVAAYLGAGFIYLMFCCFYRNTGSSPSDSIIPALLVLGFYPLFRLVLLVFQVNVPKLRKSSWVLGNIPGIIFVWLAFAYLFTYFEEPALGVFLVFVALAISELLTVNLLTIVKHESSCPKRKVEDL